jgi:glycosyltransferase involved in cell wall biosynthesis
MTPAPDITVVLCTYNRAERVERAVRAILAQHGCAFELVVVDDGSTDATPKVLASIDDDRLRVIRRPNGGLSRARNTGLAAAEGAWTVFIDDDDLVEPGWLATFHAQTADPTVGIAACGATFVDADGDVLFTHHPKPFGQPFGDVVGSSLAGTFAVRTDLVRRAGGYLDGLGTRHQTELFLRLLALARDAGLRMDSADALTVRIEARPATDRPGVNPRRLYDGTRWILARHDVVFAGQRTAIARYETVAATNAARLGDWASARRRFLRVARAEPRSPKTWGRLALAAVPVVGGRVWNRHGVWATHDVAEVGVARQATADGDEPRERELFLTWRYRENPPTPAGRPGAPALDEPAADADRPGRAPAYRLAARLAHRRRWSPVLDVGDGSPDDIAAAESASRRPGLTLCVDVVHRVDDPVGLLRRLADVSAGAPVIVSTPDRAIADPDRPLGPPSDPHHRREWTADQFELLLLSTGFDIERSWHLPPGSRRWGRRSCMVFLARTRKA